MTTARGLVIVRAVVNSHCQITDFGFKWGSCEVIRMCSDEKRGWVIVGIKTPKSEKPLQIYVTKSGILRVFSDKEWKP